MKLFFFLNKNICKIVVIIWKVIGFNNDCDLYIVSFIILRVEVEVYFDY